MINVNTSQVQRTNNVSIVSKCSAARKNYFRDDFIEEFAGKPKGRTSLIHLGYYARAETFNKFINAFIEFLNRQKVLKFQVVSCGCGFDTTYWRLSQLNLLNDKSILIEIDFPSVVQEKLLMIYQSQKLKNYLSEAIHPQSSSRVHKLSNNYYLLEADLSNLGLVEELLCKMNINFDIPTLFLSECAITYMKTQDSDNLIKWMEKKFSNSCFINYEQIHPFDSFGQIMINHFEKLRSSLFSVLKYPDCKSHISRYKDLGFDSSFAFSEWDALMCLTTAEERKKIFSLEIFDEYEEFHLKCVHYVIALAGNGISSIWMDSFPFLGLNVTDEIDSRPKLNCDIVNSCLQLCKHCSFHLKGCSFLFGGFNGQNRSCEIYKYTHKNHELQSLKNLESIGIKLDLVYGTATYFQINKVPFVCLYGGRTSPDKIWNNGLPVVFELVEENKFLLRSIIIEGDPLARYRSTMVLLNSNETCAELWMFGGRPPDTNHSLSDFWQLVISHEDEKSLTCKWKQIEERGNLWPCGRLSHSFCACIERNALFLIGGLNTDSSCVLNDMWKWCCDSQCWQRIELIGKFLPRYGHASHLKNNTIYLVGGVSTLAGMQPGLAIICLTNLTVTEYDLPVLSPPSLLISHTSVIFDDVIEILGGGGQCFSFGTYVNKQIVRIRIDRSSRGLVREEI